MHEVYAALVWRESFASNTARHHSDGACVLLNGDRDGRARLEGRRGVSGGVALHAGSSSCAGKPTDEGDTSGRRRSRWDGAARDDHRTTGVTASRVARRHTHTHTQAARSVKRRSQRKWSDGTLRGDRRQPMESALAGCFDAASSTEVSPVRGRGLFNFSLLLLLYFLPLPCPCNLELASGGGPRSQ